MREKWRKRIRRAARFVLRRPVLRVHQGFIQGIWVDHWYVIYPSPWSSRKIETNDQYTAKNAIDMYGVEE